MRRDSWVVLPTLILLAWGVLAFGAVYAWAYTPLLVVAALVGITAFVIHWRQGLPENEMLLVIAWLALALAVVVQLVPLPPVLLATLSPATPRFLEQFDLGYLARALPEGLDQVSPAAVPQAATAWHALSIRPAATEVGLVFLVVLGVLMFGLTRSFSRDGLRRTVQGIIVLAAIVAFIGIAQRSILGDHAYGGMRIYGVWQPKSLLVTPFGPFVNKNHFAGWMLMALPLALGYLCSLLENMREMRTTGIRDRILWLSTPQGGQFLLVGLAVVLMAFSLLMTGSRSGVLSLILAMMAAGAVAARAFRSTKARASITVVFVLLFVLPVTWLGADIVFGRFASGGSALQLRLDAWQSALNIFRAFPLAGTGLNTFGVATLLYQVGTPDLHFDQAHNDYLQILAEGGLLLALPALLLVAAFARSITRLLMTGLDDAETRWLRTGAVIGLVAIAAQSLVEFSLQMPGNTVLFVVLAAAALHVPSTTISARLSRDLHTGSRRATSAWIQ